MKPFVRRSLTTGACLFGLIALVHLIENARGRSAWRAWEQEQTSAGNLIPFAQLIPPAIPDDQNFAAAPLVVDAVAGKGWGVSIDTPVCKALAEPPANHNWRTSARVDLKALEAATRQDLRSALKPYEPALAALTEASKRPHSRLKVNYEKEEIPALLGFRAMGRLLQTRCLLNLQEGRVDEAWADLQTGLRVIRHFDGEPYLLCQLLRSAYFGIFMQPVWEGLVAHRWNEAQLRELQTWFAQEDILPQWKRCFQAEISMQSSMLEAQPGWWERFKLRQHWLNLERPIGRGEFLLRTLLIPDGWRYQNALSWSRDLQTLVVTPIDPEHHLMHPELERSALATLQHRKRSPYRLIGSPTPLISQNVRTARFQVGLDQAQIACALERYRMNRKAYPTDLKQLTPDFMAQLPHDLTTGEAFRYTSTAKGYKLWSCGWNMKDEGGQVSTSAMEEGDWTWAIPE